MKSTDKVVIHSYIVLPMGGIIVKMDYSPFGLGTSGGLLATDGDIKSCETEPYIKFAGCKIKMSKRNL